MVCEGRGEREREGRSTRQGQMRLRCHNKLLSLPKKKKQLNTCVHVSRGRQGPPPLHEMSTRHHTISPSPSLPPSLSLCLAPSPPTPHPHDVCALWFSFGFILDYLSSVWPTQHSVSARLSVCLSARLSVCLSVFLFIFRLFVWLLARAIESNYNICEEGSSNHGRHGMARCDTMRS